jgi:hypothetical protein
MGLLRSLTRAEGGVMTGIARSLLLASGALLAAATGAQAAEDWEHDWVVVTMARDGSWGVGVGRSTTVAITAAIRDCRAMANGPSDCGAEFVSMRNAWALGLVCGEHRILVTGDDLEDAEAAARFSATELRLHYVPDLPACRGVLTVEPSGVARGVTTLARAR